jgi:hypothetical protein
MYTHTLFLSHSFTLLLTGGASLNDLASTQNSSQDSDGQESGSQDSGSSMMWHSSWVLLSSGLFGAATLLLAVL